MPTFPLQSDDLRPGAAPMASIGLAFVEAWLSAGLFIFVALIWLVPDPRIEAVLERDG